MNLKAIKRNVLLSVLLAQTLCSAQETDIATCLSTAPGALRIEYGGKTYLLRDQECKTLFETDPERYSQLVDALLEENGKGSPKPQTPQPRASESASLVPS